MLNIVHLLPDDTLVHLSIYLYFAGLATHEPNFTIIREEFKPNQPRPCGICSQYGHEMADCCGLPKVQEGEHGEIQSQPPGSGTNYIFIRICTIREVGFVD